MLFKATFPPITLHVINLFCFAPIYFFVILLHTCHGLLYIVMIYMWFSNCHLLIPVFFRNLVYAHLQDLSYHLCTQVSEICIYSEL